MSLPTEDLVAEEPTGGLVHWMSPTPRRVGPATLSVTALSAFALGVAAAFGAIAAYRWLAPRREGLPPWRWGRGRLH